MTKLPHIEITSDKCNTSEIRTSGNNTQKPVTKLCNFYMGPTVLPPICIQLK
jgi:hypothetical protein